MANDFTIVLDDEGNANRVGFFQDSTQQYSDIYKIKPQDSGIPGETKRVMLEDSSGVLKSPEQLGVTSSDIIKAEKRANDTIDLSVATEEESLADNYIRSGMSPTVACRKAKAQATGISEAEAKKIIEKEGCAAKYQGLSDEISAANVQAGIDANNFQVDESYQAKFPFDTSELRSKLVSKVTGENIVFHVSPTIDESRSATYDQINPVHHPGSILVYKTTQSRNFSVNAKLIARNRQEATRNSIYLNLVRSWVMPYYGKGTANNPYTGDRLGAPPDLLSFSAYGEQNIKDMPVVLTSYSWTYTNDVDYIPTLTGVPFPVVIDLSLTIIESISPDEITNFDLVSYKLGLFSRAFKTGEPTQFNKNTTAAQFVLDSDRYAKKTGVA